MPQPDADAALGELLAALDSRSYRFVTPTPATHRRVLRRPDKQRARDLRDVFGWSLPFEAGDVPSDILALMQRADVVREADGRFRSAVRVSSLDERLFLHSAFPPKGEDAVFFGPDSYRFAAFVRREAGAGEGGLIVDVGAGSGVGGVVAAASRPGARVLLTDVNTRALRLARINAAHAGVTVETREAESLEGADGAPDLVLCNPPYMIASDGRTYREGGGMHGAELSLAWTQAAAERLRPGGRLLMYTGSAIVDGRDAFREAAGRALEAADCDWSYEEIDPDVFGEELNRAEYADVERIAVVGLVAVKRS